MLIIAMRLWFALTTHHNADWNHEAAHHVCEVVLYGLVSPEARDDVQTDWGEAMADLLCRNEPSLPGEPTDTWPEANALN